MARRGVGFGSYHDEGGSDDSARAREQRGGVGRMAHARRLSAGDGRACDHTGGRMARRRRWDCKQDKERRKDISPFFY